MTDSTEPPLSVVIPALDAATTLPATLAALEEGWRAAVVREMLVVDGGSRDGTSAMASANRAHVIAAPRGRGAQLAAGGAAASGEWLLFLHADTVLAPGWAAVVTAFIAEPRNTGRAGYFRLVLDDPAPEARRIERWAEWRCRRFALPYGDQGLLLSRRLYHQVGGFRPLPLMEDVDLVRRLGSARLAPVAADAVTSAARYRRGGWVRRPLRNLACLALYFLGLPPPLLRRLYG
jgi:rSAM/selenodomain-associated transferase 2